MKIHHLGYVTRSMEKSIRGYEALGFERMGEAVEDRVQNNRIQFLKQLDSEMQIELIEPLENSTMQNFADGFQHICYDVRNRENFEEWFKALKIGRLYQKNIIAPALGGARVWFACLIDHSFVEFIVE